MTQRSGWADAAVFALYNGVSHLVFAPDAWSSVNLLITGAFAIGQAAAVYPLLFAIQRLSAREGVQQWWLGLIGPLLLFVATCIPYPLLLLIGAFVPELGTNLTLTDFLLYWAPKILWGVLLMCAVAVTLYSGARRRATRRRAERLEQERSQAELAFLRGQLNPHFLFNALNSIHVLIRQDPNRAADSLAGFSDLLRYQLYRTEAELVPLAEEIGQLRKFAELHLLRTEKDFRFELTAPEDTSGQLPPMVLLPLLENAFKYTPQYGGYIGGRLTADDDRLCFQLVNNINPRSSPTSQQPDGGGIGLSNIRRRLDLLYPGDYRLATDTTTDTHTLTLNLPLR